MKKITLNFFVIMFMFGTFTGFSQTLNQNASWPNSAWILTGTDAAETDVDILEANPTTVDANFAFDDDDAGGGSDNDIAAESPVIDLTAAAAAGETWISVFGDYVYRYLADDALLFEYWDADAAVWVAWGPEFDAGTAGAPTNNYCSATSESFTTNPLDIASFTATQLSGFRYRISYNDNPAGSDWNYGFCFQSPTIVSAVPPSCFTPTALSATVSTVSTAELSWNPGGTESLWDIEVVDITASGTVTGTPTATGVTNPYMAMGLTEGNDYEFYVRSDCEGDGLSEWSGPFAWTQNVPPANDECSNAIALTVNTDLNCSSVTVGTTVFATASPQPDDVTGTPNNDVWFSFVASAPEHRVSLTNVTAVTGFSTDMGMGVYNATGGCTALVFEDDSDPNTLDLSGLTEGTTYLVRVYGWSSSATSTAQTTFDICVGTPCQADAGTLTADEESVVFSGGTVTISATPNGDIAVPAGYEVIYVLTSGPTLIIEQASATPSFDVSAINDYTIHTLVAEISDNTDPNFLDLSVIVFGTTTGADVLDLISSGDICADLDVTGAPISVNDGSELDFYNVQYIEETGSSPSNGSSESLTIEVGTSVTVYAQGYELGLTDASGQAAGVECWIAINNENTDPSTWDDAIWQIATYNADAGNNDEYFYETSATPLGANYVAARWRLNNAGFTYGGFNGAWDGTSNVNIELIVDPLANDDCAGAIPLSVGGIFGSNPVDGTVSGATSDAVGASCGSDGPGVWYSVVVPASGNLTIETGDDSLGGTGFDSVIEAFSGTCGSLTSIDCDDDGVPGFGDNYSILELTSLTPGETIYVRVWEYGGNDDEPYSISAYDCSADAGTLTADASTVNLLGATATISATPNGDIVVPTDYEVTYVLTSGPTLIIEDAGATPNFEVDTAGDYTIHTLVAETSDNTDPNFLDLSVIVFGTTTGGDVLGIVTGAGLCASLDVTGAPITVVECTADAGTLTADATPVNLLGATATISATPNGDIVVPTDYEVTYVLTSGPTLIIEDAGATPSFDVDTAGDYTIHTLVAETSDNTDPNFLDLSVIVFGTTTGGDVLGIVTGAGLCASLDVTGAPITVVECTADAGTLTADATPVNLLGATATISATPNGDIVVPTDYEVTYVLTSGPTLIIEDAGATPSFDVDTAGDYTIHTLVAETSDNTDPNFLDLSVIIFGTTTGGDVLGIVTGAGLCASLDVTGAPITVVECTADAGTLTADETTVSLSGGTATISATPNGDIVVPTDYEVTYVLTSGPTLIIEDAGATPSFDVDTAGDYTIHTLVAETSDNTDPNFLDLSVIVFGTTTGGDVLGIVTGAGLCASLDVTGAPITVTDDLSIDDNSFANVEVYPNPVKENLILSNSRNIFINSISLYDIAGRAVKRISVNNNSSELRFNLSELSAGVYILILDSDLGQFEKQIIKE